MNVQRSAKSAPKIRVIAHRGAGAEGEYPANTLKALEWGLNNADGVETDLRMDAKGTVWLSHDDDVVTKTGKRIRISTSTTEELERVQIAGKGNESNYPLATLAQLLDLLKGYPNKLAILETKSISGPGFRSPSAKNQYYRDIAAKQNALIRDKGVAAQIQQSSFNSLILRKLRKADAFEGTPLERRLLTRPHPFSAVEVAFAAAVRAGIGGVHVGIGPEDRRPLAPGIGLFSYCAHHFSSLGSWGANGPIQIRQQIRAAGQARLAELDIITDDPEGARDVVHQARLSTFP